MKCYLFHIVLIQLYSTSFNVSLRKWVAESFKEPALLLHNGRCQVQKVGDLHELRVRPF